MHGRALLSDVWLNMLDLALTARRRLRAPSWAKRSAAMVWGREPTHPETRHGYDVSV
jgi:hypothetical protein